MSEHQKELTFLRHVILYDGSDERGKLEQSIAQVQRDKRCVLRLTSVAVLLLMLVLAGVAYGIIFQENFPYNPSDLVFKLLCELSLALLFCLAAFASLLTLYWLRLNRLRQDCRHLVKKLLESHLGDPHIATSRTSQPVSDHRPGPPTSALRPLTSDF
jgi:hypothetical protein